MEKAGWKNWSEVQIAAADRAGWRDCVEALCATWHEEDRQQVTYTSKPYKWNVPHKCKGSVKPIHEMSIVNHDYVKEKKTKKPKLTLQEDNNASDQGNWPSDRLDNFLEALRLYYDLFLSC